MTVSTLLQHETLGKADHYGTYALPDVVVSKTANYTANAGEYVLCDTTSAGFTVTLPASPTAGQTVGIKKTSADTNAVAISPNVDGASITVTTQNHSLFVEYDGTAWRARSGHYPKGTFGQTAAGNTWLAQQSFTPGAGLIALSVKDQSGNETFRVQSDGNITFGAATVEPNVRLIGAGGTTQWAFGIDDANAPLLSDFYIARGETGTSVSDFLYIRNGHSQSNPPRLGVGNIPLDADNNGGTDPPNKGVLETSVWTTTTGKTFHNFLAKVHDATAPTQTGYAFAISRENNAIPFAVDVLGRTLARQVVAGNNAALTNSTWITNDEATALLIPSKSDGKALVLQGMSGQSDHLLAWVNNSTVPLGAIMKAGHIMTQVNGAPADTDLTSNQLALWFDSTAGAAKVMWKAKDAGGTVRTGSLALA